MTPIIVTLNAGNRVELAATIECLINVLDAMDGDCDFEPYLAGWDERSMDDFEDECEDEGAQCDDEGCIDSDPPGTLEGGQGL